MKDRLGKPRWWVLCIALLLQLIVNPCLHADLEGGRHALLMLINSIAILAVMYRLSYKIVHFIVGIILGLPLIVYYWLPSIEGLNQSFLIVLGVLYLYTIITTVPALLRAQKVGTDEIFGALSLYILIGLSWALLYAIIEVVEPGSYRVTTQEALNIGDFIYFSFTTLTTLGYGDVTPLSCEARVLSSLEAISGLMCLSVVIGRLIGMRQMTRGKPKNEGDHKS